MKAVIDAATLYGASRHFRRVHEDDGYAYKSSFNPEQDRLLFLEFLHALLLYEDISLDNSSIDIDRESDDKPFWSGESPLRKELMPLIENVASEGGPAIVDRDLCFLEENDHDLIKDFICDRLSNGCDVATAERVPVPWGYNETHADYYSFKFRCEKAGIPTLIGFTLFLYRALVYAAFARQAESVYLAAPGRLKALDVFLHDSDKGRFDFARRGYGDVLSMLKLPRSGYDFSYLSNTASGAHELSVVSRQIHGIPPEEAITEVLKIRRSADGLRVRETWAGMVARQNSLVGMAQIQISQSVDHASVAGDLVQSVFVSPQYIVATPRW
jgi:hypothetical protein